MNSPSLYPKQWAAADTKTGFAHQVLPVIWRAKAPFPSVLQTYQITALQMHNSISDNGHITSIQLIVNTLRIIINVTSNPKQSTAVRDPILSKYGNLCHICWSLDWNIRMGRARPGTEIQIVEAISEKKNRSKNYTLPSRGLLFFYFNCSHFQALFEKRLCSQLNVRARCSSTILPR